MCCLPGGDESGLLLAVGYIPNTHVAVLTATGQRLATRWEGMLNMEPLQERRYADKYRGMDQPIHLIAGEFSKNTRNVTAFEVARA